MLPAIIARLARAIGLGTAGSSPRLSASKFNGALSLAFQRVLGPHGFEQVAERKWVRSVKGPIREVVELYSLKHLSVVARWGFSFDFSSHVDNSGVRWHRTPKSANLDIVWDPIDFDDSREWELSPCVAESRLETLASAFATKILEAAIPYFNRVAALEDVPDLYAEWERRPFVRFGFENYHQALVGQAFVLKMLNRPGGNELLEQAINKFGYSDVDARELRRRLSAIPAPGR